MAVDIFEEQGLKGFPIGPGVVRDRLIKEAGTSRQQILDWAVATPPRPIQGCGAKGMSSILAWLDPIEAACPCGAQTIGSHRDGADLYPSGWVAGEGGARCPACAQNATADTTTGPLTAQAGAGAPPPAPAAFEARAPGRFVAATPKPRRVKLLLWGSEGVGKTTTALCFPQPLVIDLEGATDLYASSFSFDVPSEPVTRPDQVLEIAQWLLRNDHPYKTLIIDPITAYWSALMRKWSDILKDANPEAVMGHLFEFYDLEATHWMTIKAEHRELVSTLKALDCNVVVTARLKARTDASGGEIGVTFEGEKGLAHDFDTVVQLHRDTEGRFVGFCHKDLTGCLPHGAFAVQRETFADLFNGQAITATAPPTIAKAQALEIASLQEALGVTTAMMAATLERIGYPSGVADLTPEQASDVIGRMRRKLEA